MTKKMGKKINACEMWIWRKMQRISWMEKKTNESVRMEIGIEEDEMLQQTVLRRKLELFGHVMRSDGLEKRMMLAHGDGRRRRGQPRRKWMDKIHEVTGMKLAELRDVMTERKSGGKWSRQSLELNELTAQGDKMKIYFRILYSSSSSTLKSLFPG